RDGRCGNAACLPVGLARRTRLLDYAHAVRITAEPGGFFSIASPDRYRAHSGFAGPASHRRREVLPRTGVVSMSAKPYYVQIVAGLLIVATILLMWFGYRATSEWRRSTEQMASRRAGDAVYLMVTALSRDMRAVQSQVLPQLNPLTHESEIYELSDEI